MRVVASAWGWVKRTAAWAIFSATRQVPDICDALDRVITSCLSTLMQGEGWSNALIVVEQGGVLSFHLRYLQVGVPAPWRIGTALGMLPILEKTLCKRLTAQKPQPGTNVGHEQTAACLPGPQQQLRTESTYPPIQQRPDHRHAAEPQCNVFAATSARSTFSVVKAVPAHGSRNASAVPVTARGTATAVGPLG